MARFGRKSSLDPVFEEPKAPALPSGADPPTTGGASVLLPRVSASEAKDFIRDQIFARVEPLVAVKISKQELLHLRQ